MFPPATRPETPTTTSQPQLVTIMQLCGGFVRLLARKREIVVLYLGTVRGESVD